MLNKKNNRMMNNKAGQIFIISVVVAVTIALGTSYVLLNYMFKSTAENQKIGAYQSSIVQSISDGDKVSIYLDSAYKIATTNAFDEYLHDNPNPKIDNENADGSADDSDINYCGNYVYRVWNTQNKNCYPNYNSKDFELNTLIDKNMGELTYLQKKDSDANIISEVLSQQMYYDYDYSFKDYNTLITAYPKDSYKIYTINGADTNVKSAEVQEYLATKNYVGADGDISGVPLVPVASSNYRESSSRKIEYIVMHYTAGSNIDGAMSRFLTPGAGASSHYIVGSASDSYKIIQPVLDSDVAYHAGCSDPKYGCAKSEYNSINSKSIGIEIVNLGSLCNDIPTCKNNAQRALCTDKYMIGGVDRDGVNAAQCWEKYPPEQYKKIVSLVALLSKKYGVTIDRDHIIGHVEVVSKGKTDPGPAFDLDQFVLDVKTASANDESILVKDLSSVDETACIKTPDTDWSIESAKLSNTKFTSDQELKATISISNAADSCVNVKSRINIKYSLNGKNYDDSFYGSVNAYKGTQQKPFTDLEISCKFTTDEAEYISLKTKQSKCIILVSSDGKENKYTIIVDGKDYNDKTKKYDSILVVTASKYSGPAVSNIVTGDLTETQKKTIATTKTNLDNLGVMDYIAEISESEEVPQEIVLGLITQESSGKINADSGLAAGLMQVTKPTFDGTKFDDKCSWEEYKTDAKCQIRAGIAVLKDKYSPIGDKTVYYICNQNCIGKTCMGPVNKQYTGWEAALRRYNGGGDYSIPKPGSQTSGCTGQPDYEYVERVMKYANGWGYSGQSDMQIKEEINHGILGSYNIRPTLNLKMDFDFKIIDLLKDFAVSTSKKCGVDGVNRNSCIKNEIDLFNSKIPSIYSGDGLKLYNECDKTAEVIVLNKFVEELNDCKNSKDDNCNCKFSNTKISVSSMTSSNELTTVKYYSGNEYKNIYLDFDVKDISGKEVDKSPLASSDILFYKKNGVMMNGASTYAKECSVIKSIYRMCLDTNYKYTVYDKENEKTVDKYVNIPFAITIRDSKPPKAITGIGYSNLQSSNDSIILKWTPGIEEDITTYNIYLGDSKEKFDSSQTQYLKDDLKYYSLGIIDKKYTTYKSLDLVNAKCTLKDSTGSQVKYCEFTYTAIDSEGKSSSIVLEKEKLYYISSENKFMYILDGKNTDNGLFPNKEKFIAITAIDIDGNEINNLDTDQKLEVGKNIIVATPKDYLSLGLSTITNVEVKTSNNPNDPKKNLILAWNPVTINIDGTSYTGDVTYKVYAGLVSCTDNELVKVGQFAASYDNFKKTEDVGISVDKNTKCIVVSASNKNAYNSVISKSLN